MIEDDVDDQETLVDIFKDLQYENKIIYFHDGNEALAYLNRTDVHPFLILSDVNMPKIDGFELRNKIFTNEQLQTKCIPFLFFTTSGTKKSVLDAYAMSVQGYFVKSNSIEELKSTIKKIVEYWKECIAPNHYENVDDAKIASGHRP